MRRILPIFVGLFLGACVAVSIPGTVALAWGVEGGQSNVANTQVDVCGSPNQRCNEFVEDYLNPFILLLTGLVGVTAVISIIMAGIQYAASADDPGTVTKAKQRIFNTVIGLVAYIFLFAFLNYLVPGGFF